MKRKFFGSEEKIRKQQLEMISMLNRWYQVKEDLLFAFEKCSESSIGEPTKSYIQDFIVRIKGGLSIERALELFADSYSNKQFRNFATQIQFNLKYRGNTGELLDNLETQFNRIEEEWTRRKIASSKDRFYLLGIFILTPIIAIFVFVFNSSAREMFFYQPAGNILSIIALMSYGAGVAIYLLSSRYLA
ncbi:MAG: type II secretion system F family protein [Saccharofermentanales bacterium]